MKIYITSDLHYDHSNHDSVKALSKYVTDRGKGDDILILGGDYGNSPQVRADCLGVFSEFPGTVVAVPGNHDVWSSDTSAAKQYENFATLCASHNIHSLTTSGSVVVGDVGVAGCMGWYDYSFRDNIPGVIESDYLKKTYPGSSLPTWNDARFVRWGKTAYELGVAKIHNDFLDIHPLVDRNGSTALLIAEFMMMRMGYEPPTEKNNNYYDNVRKLFNNNPAAIGLVAHEQYIIYNQAGYFRGGTVGNNPEQKKEHERVLGIVQQKIRTKPPTWLERIQDLIKRNKDAA